MVPVDGDSGETVGQTEVFTEPYGVVSDSSGGRVYVTLSYPGQVVEIDAASRGQLHDCGLIVVRPRPP